jgi:glyoxylase-like metal-dependent hydrolase (beta-lactamase superfamily II)
MPHRAIGDITVARILEMNYPFDRFEFYPHTTEEDWAPHLDWLMEEGALDPTSKEMILPIQSYVVRTSRHTILVDTCAGNDKHRPHRPLWHMKTDMSYLQALAKEGLKPEDIDYVMCTHLHLDHVGWNTRLLDGRWVPTFPNAKYVMSKKDLDHLNAEGNAFAMLPVNDSVLPVIEAGQAQLVESDFALDDEVWLEPSPGHTPDHFSVKISSKGQGAVMAGDMMHSPVQCLHPEWVARPDWDPALASDTRRKFMETYSETDDLVCMGHFPLPSAGRIEAQGDAFRFRYDKEKC